MQRIPNFHAAMLSVAMISFAGNRLIQAVLEGILALPVNFLPLAIGFLAFGGVVCYRMLIFTPDCIADVKGSVHGNVTNAI